MTEMKKMYGQKVCTGPGSVHAKYEPAENHSDLIFAYVHMKFENKMAAHFTTVGKLFLPAQTKGGQISHGHMDVKTRNSLAQPSSLTQSIFLACLQGGNCRGHVHHDALYAFHL